MHVVDLRDGRRHDPTGVLAGPWRYLQLLQLEPGAREVLEGGEVEYALFVVDGTGAGSTTVREVALGRGTGVVLLRGSGMELVAGPEGLRVFVEAIDVRRR